ncbi:NAD(P)-binding protein [Gonapodya prolifera JEL478]|uniref:NAD(P)-binding protein n=1 Tax=Gonapodya prolifera (strain JEL478) TaxID=1344416 RepID=A0A139ACM5_GONPJ|nr:NAD(P)-binding protein [Gonapodya prolifera JEL478]|eukprot:KXS14195.1 NAD(P)-binding protein [Gonapodya prolifera JEL478]
MQFPVRTGALGLRLVTALINKPNTTVFAGARDPLNAKALINNLQLSHPNLHIVKLTSGNVEDNAAAVAAIKFKSGRLDVVIANAGIAKSVGSIDTTPIEDFREHLEVNTLGPLVLRQAVFQLLLVSPTSEAYFGVISSALGSIGNYSRSRNLFSGVSKAAINYLVKALHVEHEAENFVATALYPGWVETEL